MRDIFDALGAKSVGDVFKKALDRLGDYAEATIQRVAEWKDSIGRSFDDFFDKRIFEDFAGWLK